MGDDPEDLVVSVGFWCPGHGLSPSGASSYGRAFGPSSTRTLAGEGNEGSQTQKIGFVVDVSRIVVLGLWFLELVLWSLEFEMLLVIFIAILFYFSSGFRDAH